MPANPEILSKLKSYVSEKTGNTFDGDPPIGGDKNKGKGVPIVQPTDRIPMFDPNNPQSRVNYVNAVVKKHNLPHGYGDVFTRFNEIPETQADTLTTKELISRTAKNSGLPPSLFYTSSMVEGMSGLYPQKGETQWSGNEKFPVDGFVNFGLDTFADAYPGLVKKGLLPADFKKRFVKASSKNEKGQKVNSANFDTAEAALMAKAAMIKDAQTQFNAYADKSKTPLSDKAKQFFTLAAYNGGPGAAQNMLQEYQKGGVLNNDAFLTTKPAQSKYGQVYNNVMQRIQLANALDKEGYQFDNPATPPQQPPIVTTK